MPPAAMDRRNMDVIKNRLIVPPPIQKDVSFPLDGMDINLKVYINILPLNQKRSLNKTLFFNLNSIIPFQIC
jgi:hypothetical protein